MTSFVRSPLHAICLLAALAANSASAVQLQLRPDAVIAERFVTVGDVAVVAGTDAAVVKAVRLAAAPRVGNVDLLTREDIERAIQRRLPQSREAVEWAGARAVKLRLATRTVDAQELSALARERLLHALQQRFEQVEIDLLAQPGELELPLGEVSFKVREIDTKQSRARIPVWVDVLVNGALYRSVAVPFAANLRQTVWVARRDLAEGVMASAADFDARLEEVTALADDLVPMHGTLQPVRMRRKLNAGQALTHAHVSSGDMVFRGDNVKLVLSDGGVMIEARAVAQEQGSLGQTVRVKPESGTQAVTARVIAMGVVRAEGR